MQFDFAPAMWLTNVALIELGLNTCSNRCAYCAIQGNRSKGESFESILNKLQGRFRSPDSFTAQLYNSGHPITFSNRTDPFCKSNFELSIPVLEVLNERKNGVVIQTKLNANWKDGDTQRVFDAIKDKSKGSVVFYVSVTGDTKLAAEMEPQAAAFETRMDFCRTVKDAGYPLIFAINPCVQEFWNADALVSAMDSNLTEYVFLQALHVEKYRSACESMLLQAGIEKARNGWYGWDFAYELIEDLIKQGKNPCGAIMGYITDYTCVYQGIQNAFPLAEEFHSSYESWNEDDFIKFAVSKVGDIANVKSWEWQRVLVRSDRRYLKDYSKKLNLAEVLKIAQSGKVQGCIPYDNDLFTLKGERYERI